MTNAICWQNYTADFIVQKWQKRGKLMKERQLEDRGTNHRRELTIVEWLMCLDADVALDEQFAPGRVVKLDEGKTWGLLLSYEPRTKWAHRLTEYAGTNEDLYYVFDQMLVQVGNKRKVVPCSEMLPAAVPEDLVKTIKASLAGERKGRKESE